MSLRRNTSNLKNKLWEKKKALKFVSWEMKTSKKTQTTQKKQKKLKKPQNPPKTSKLIFLKFDSPCRNKQFQVLEQPKPTRKP